MAVPKLDLLTQFADAFVARIRDLPQLREVILDDGDGEAHIWIFIDAPRMDYAYREPIHAAEFEAYRQFPNVDVEFRLINLREYGETNREPPQFVDAPRLWPDCRHA